jgi:hypothetical protein
MEKPYNEEDDDEEEEEEEEEEEGRASMPINANVEVCC